MSQYAIWNKSDTIITPVGEVLTAEQWMERYPVARLDNITVVCAAGEINGAFFGTLGQMVDNYTRMGADFSECTTAEEKLQAIEDFLNELEAKNVEAAKIATENAEITATSLASIAASMEYQNMMSLEDVEVE